MSVPDASQWVGELVAAATGFVGGGWLVKMLVTRHLKQFDSAYNDIHSIKTDIAVIKERINVATRLETKVNDIHDRVVRLEGEVHSINKQGCEFSDCRSRTSR